ncbi:MAG: DegT/DnrJ/EryC1/StrS family aminotransferase [Saprospiraceae bacterium]
MSTSIPMVDLQGQYQRLKAELDPILQNVLDSCYFVGGPQVKSFSENLAAYLDVKHVIPCGNGTDALQLALMAMDLKPGDEVITTPFTFVATVEVIALLGLKPVFVDCEADTFNIDPKEVAKAITDKTRCIIPVHLFGQSSNMEALQQIVEGTDIYLLEDNAQAIGAEYYFKDSRSQKAGTIGHIGTTSFFPSKNLGCYGDGGAVFTNDDKLAEKVRMYGNHGMKVRYYHDTVGINSRLDALQAAVLNVKLKHLNDFNAARVAAADYYDQTLSHLGGVTIPYRATYSNHVFHQYTLKLEHGRDALLNDLKNEGIASAVYYPVPLHLQKAYAAYGYQKGDFPVAETLAEKVLSLPIHTELEQSIQNKIVNTLKKSLAATV